jgi:hypothetical protein
MIQEQYPQLLTIRNIIPKPNVIPDTMNNITTDEWTNISRLINESENLYSATQLNQRAQYIFNGLYKDTYLSWGIYIYGGRLD